MRVIGRVCSSVARLFAPSAARPWKIAGFVILGIIFIAAVLMRLRLPALPMADPDSWGYLSPALTLLASGQLVQENGRDWLYSGLVYLALEIFGSLAGLVRFQQVLGVLSGALMMTVLRLWARFLPASGLREAGVAVVGGLAAAIYLLRPDTMSFEMQLRPESVWCFFIFLQQIFLLAYCWERWAARRLGRALACAVPAVCLAYVNLLLKPSWGFAFVVTVLPVFLGVFGSRRGLFLRLLTPALAVGATVLLLWLPARYFFVRDEMGPNRLPLALFTIHAKWILEGFEDKVKALPAGDPERAFLERFLPVFHQEFARALEEDSVYRQLGFDADYLRYRSPIFSWLENEAGISDEKLMRFCFDGYRDAWRFRPGGMASKIGRQFQLFLLPEREVIYKRGIKVRQKYLDTLQELPESLPPASAAMETFYQAYRADVARASTTVQDVEPWEIFKWLALLVARAAPFLTVLFLIALGGCWKCPALSGFRAAGLTGLLIYAAPAANAMTVAVIHALDVWRYRMSYAGLVLLGLAVILIFLVLVVAALAAREKFPENTR